MQVPLSLYDFFGYALPGLIVIVIAAILIITPLGTDRQLVVEFWLDMMQDLIDPRSTSENEIENAESKSRNSLPTTVIRMVLYGLICYLVGFATHGVTYWSFGLLSKIWEPLKRYHSDHGSFEKGLFCQEHRDYPEDFGPYTNKFVDNLKSEIEDVFDIKVETIQKEVENAKNDVKYTEIFDLCRTIVLKQSPDLYSRGFALLARYNSAKLMGVIFFCAMFAFFLKLAGFQQGISWIILLTAFVLPLIGRKGARLGLIYGLITVVLALVVWGDKRLDPLFICYSISAALCPIFFHLYHVLFRYYRNTILYGFYEYAVTRDKSEKSENREKLV